LAIGKAVDWRKKLAIVVLIIGAGLGLALQYRKQTTSSSAAVAAPDEISTVTASATPSVNAAPSIANAAVPRDTSSSPPADIENRTAAAKGQLVDLNEPERTHTIADGDTLSKLAEHYLGSADRSAELFQYNRDVLPNMDVLPIGAELRVPPRIAIVDPQNPKPPSAVVMRSPGPLVPLTQPAAQTTTPAPQPKRRTYTVEANDNLVDIARKFYGDGRRYQDLYEANRRTMKNPTDLKAGMVLIVP
jgi:nucleoid-associated protein YgaU